MKNSSAPVRDTNVAIDSIETRMGKKTIELHHISKKFGDRICIRDFDYIVLKNQRLGIIGPNGCGKSTLLKIIAGIIQPDSGEVEIGDTVKIGYFSQEIEDMNTSQRVIDYIKDVAEFIPTKDGLISASKLLEQFLFDAAMQYAPIEKLSGGEKKRLYLLKVLASAPNVLLLDEPIILQTVFLSLTEKEISHSMKAATQITLKQKSAKAFLKKRRPQNLLPQKMFLQILQKRKNP